MMFDHKLPRGTGGSMLGEETPPPSPPGPAKVGEDDVVAASGVQFTAKRGRDGAQDRNPYTQRASRRASDARASQCSCIERLVMEAPCFQTWAVLPESSSGLPKRRSA